MGSIEANHYDEERDEKKMSKADAHKARIEGKKLWEEMPSEEAVRERDQLIEKLEAYDKAVPGVNTKVLREELRKNGNKPKNLVKIKKKLDKLADKEYFRRMSKHEAFNVPGKLGRVLQKEMNELHDGFKGLELMKGSYSKFDILTKLEETLAPKAKFAKRYNKQTPYVRRLFEQSMDKLSFVDSKADLLKKVLKLVGELEDSPQAIQSEFKKRSESIKDAGKLRVMKAKLITEYAERENAYRDLIDENREYFGGDSADEFITWYGEQESATKMKHALKVLPEYIKERKEEHEHIEELIGALPKKKAERFRGIISKLGLSERKAYRKETLEPAARTGNLMVAEYEGELLAAHQDRFPLYTSDEKANLAARFKTLDLKAQKNLLFVERLNIADRERVVKDYQELPLNVRDDLSFYKANSITRQEMLGRALRELKESNAGSAFAELASGEILDNERIRDITDGLDSREGEDLLAEAYEDQVAEADRKNVDNVISLAGWKAKMALDANKKGESQAETFMSDYENWKEGLSVGDHEKDASLENDWLKASKIREAQMAENLYEKGFTTHAGSNINERQDLRKKDLTDLNGERIRDAMSRAKYSTDIHLSENNDSEPTDVAELLGDALEEMAVRMAREMAEGLAAKMKAQGSNRLTLVNSLTTAKNIGTIKDKFCENEMSGSVRKLRKTSKKAA